MLRLTLRTLLAYLDDTLGPAQTRDIGKKVAESEVAQHTVERIKTITRRRRLAAPRTEPDDLSTDPNTIAEYLDNVLPSDQVTELEEAALQSDVRLAEVASCHQILTLVLGEPAHVPPTARVRMYRLVNGPEAIPFRRPTTATPVGVVSPTPSTPYVDDDSEESLLGPRNVAWMMTLLAAAALLVLAVWLAVPPSPQNDGSRQVTVVAANTNREPTPVLPKFTEKPKLPPALVKQPEPPVVKEELEVGPAPREIKGNNSLPPVGPPDAERRAVATWDATSGPLLYRRRETTKWEKATAADPRLSTTDTVVALPGLRPDLRLDSGVTVILWGVSPEVGLPVNDARVTLHVPSPGIDAELTLQNGRIILAAPQAMVATVVRVRFQSEVWDVTLKTRDSQVGIDLYSEPASGIFGVEFPEAPRVIAYLGAKAGAAEVRAGFTTMPLAEGELIKWDSKGGRPGPAPKDDFDSPLLGDRWRRELPPAAKDPAAAVAEWARRLAMSQGPFEVDFHLTVQDNADKPLVRSLAAWNLAAVDSVSYLIDALELDQAATVRDAAGRALKQWVASGAGRDEELTRVLGMKMAFGDMQRLDLAALARGTPTVNDLDRLFEALKSDRLAVRELARINLSKVDPVGARDSKYEAGSTNRNSQASAWQQSWKRREAKPKPGK